MMGRGGVMDGRGFMNGRGQGFGYRGDGGERYQRARSPVPRRPGEGRSRSRCCLQHTLNCQQAWCGCWLNVYSPIVSALTDVPVLMRANVEAVEPT